MNNCRKVKWKMSNLSKILWGIVFIVIGIIIGLNALGVTNINIFFDGWWTLFIIIPCLIGLFDNDSEGKTGNLIGIVIGVILLLAIRGVISFQIVGKLIIPIIFVGIGLSIIFNETLKSKVSDKVKEAKKNGLETYAATFGEQNVKKDGEDFNGANLDAVFGSVNLDLRKANITNETAIKASAIFGGVEILVPENVNVKVKSTPIFGGVSNKTTYNKESQIVVYIDAFCMFGGVDIK
mgnify:FL=1